MSATARIARPRGESKQDYCTPRAFLDAVEQKFGPIVWDLAATLAQSVIEPRRARGGIVIPYFGPDHERADHRDALAVSWEFDSSVSGLRWLNPPFSHIAPWAERCARYATADSPIALLVPASIGSNWYWDHCAPHARTYSVERMMFVVRHADGSETPACFDKHGRPTKYNKDLMLCVFTGFGKPHVTGDRVLMPGLERWRWQDA